MVSTKTIEANALGPSSSRTRRFLESALLWCLISFIKVCPRLGLNWFSKVISYVSLANSRDQKRIKKNLLLVKNLPDHSIFAKMFARQVLRFQASMLIETLKELIRPGSLTIEGTDEYKAVLINALEAKKGVVIVTAHLGSWEMVAACGAKATQGPFHALAKPTESAALNQTLDALRSHHGTNVLWTDQKTLLRSMMAALKANEPLGFVMDQKPDMRVGPSVPFMGQDTIFAAGPAKIILKQRPPVVSVYCVRLAPWRYKIYAEDITKDLSECQDVESITGRLAIKIEQRINQYPEQWLWNYKRW